MEVRCGDLKQSFGFQNGGFEFQCPWELRFGLLGYASWLQMAQGLGFRALYAKPSPLR